MYLYITTWRNLTAEALLPAYNKIVLYIIIYNVCFFSFMFTNVKKPEAKGDHTNKEGLFIK